MKRTLSYCFMAAVLYSCNTHYQPNPDNDIGKGTFTVPCETAACALLMQQKEVFENIFDSATVEVQCMSEESVVKKLVTGEERCGVISRWLTQQELQQIQQADSALPRQHIFAYDAIAVIASRQTAVTDSLFNYEQLLGGLVSGQMGAATEFIFDNESPGMAAFLKNQIGAERKFASNVFALQGTDSVVAYVAARPSAIGFVPYSVFSDSDEKRTEILLTNVKPLTLKQTDSTGAVSYVTANQSDIASGEYPMKRGLNIVICNPRKRVVVGFVNFLHQQKAARVFLKAGLVPRYIPEREIVIDTSHIFH